MRPERPLHLAGRSAGDRKLRLVLIDRPGPRRDGRQLQLELDGYEVIPAWDADALDGELDRADLAELVVVDEDQVRRLREFVDCHDFSAPLLVRSSRSRAELVRDGLRLRSIDHLVAQV